jgi:hypothetical protein
MDKKESSFDFINFVIVQMRVEKKDFEKPASSKFMGLQEAPKMQTGFQ